MSVIPEGFTLDQRVNIGTGEQEYTLHAPLWRTKWLLTEEEANNPIHDLPRYMVRDGVRRIVGGILDNRVVREAVDAQIEQALEVAKKNLHEWALRNADSRGMIEAYQLHNYLEEDRTWRQPH